MLRVVFKRAGDPHPVAKMLLAAVAAVAVVASAAWAQSDLDALYEQLAEINQRYGFAPEPDGEQELRYRAEIQGIHDMYEADFAAVEAMHAELAGASKEIARIEERASEVDRRYGFSPLPQLSPEQRDAYEERARAVAREADRYWEEYARALESDPGAAPDRAETGRMEAEMAALDAEYGFGPLPDLSAGQRDEYEAEMAAFEAEKAPHFAQIDRAMAAHRGSLERLEEAARLLRAAGEKHGVPEAPRLGAEELAAYEAEVEAVKAKIDEIEAAQEAAYRAALARMGVTLPSGDDPGFDGDLARLAAEHPQIEALGDPGASADYGALEEIAPQIREVFERHGYEFGASSAEQFRQLDELMSRGARR